jgi:hypothetical protein
MRKLFVLVGVALTALMALSSSAAASTTCNSTTALTGATITGDLVVPEDGVCTIISSSVGGDVRVGKNAYFQSTGSQIGDDVEGRSAQTILIDGGSTVGDDVKASRVAQVFVFDSTVNGLIEVHGSTQQVNVCGNTVDGRIEVKYSGRDILIGDPKTIGCAGNTVLNNHRIRVEDNFVDVELIIRGNTIQGGDLEVNRNEGPADKFVEDNKGGYELECRGNEEPFAASGNTGWNRTEGQCAIPPTECTTDQSGVNIAGDLIVPDGTACTIRNSTVGGNVKVGRDAFFQSITSTIAGDVKGRRSVTVFVDSQSTVGGDVDTSGTFQTLVFNSSVGEEIDVRGTTSQVNICGNQVQQDIEVSGSDRDILVGDPLTADCPGNSVGGDIEVVNNDVDKELVVRGNRVGDDLFALGNEGAAAKFVQDNTGVDRLVCRGNEDPFTGTPNTGFASTEGQCAI